MIIAVVSGIGLLFNAFTLLSFASGANALIAVYAAGYGGAYVLAPIGFIGSVTASALSAWGGYRMYKLDPEGKRLVIYGLALGLVSSLVTAVGLYSTVLGSSSFGGQGVGIAVTVVVYYLVVVSRFPQPAR